MKSHPKPHPFENKRSQFRNANQETCEILDQCELITFTVFLYSGLVTPALKANLKDVGPSVSKSAQGTSPLKRSHVKLAAGWNRTPMDDVNSLTSSPTFHGTDILPQEVATTDVA